MSKTCIEVKDLQKSYGSVKAVDGISFKVEKGTIFGMLGPNGAGKSTTIENLIGLQKRDQGEISIMNLDPAEDMEEIRHKIGVQLQTPALFSKLKVLELVLLFASFYVNPMEAEEVISMLGLESKKNEMTETLSGGQRHRLAVALAVVSNGDIIFLDEPTTGLDPQSRRQLWDLILELKERGKTIYLTTHYMDEAERLCDNLVIVDHGKVIARGRPEDLIKQHFQEDAIEFRNTAFSSEELEGIGELSEVSKMNIAKEKKIILYSKNASQTISDLMAYGQNLNKRVEGIELRKASLEDLFLKLTGREIR
ncbi:MAG: ABC transporter ATP-binding protein [Halanaerobiaceae bacterium]